METTSFMPGLNYLEGRMEVIATQKADSGVLRLLLIYL